MHRISSTGRASSAKRFFQAAIALSITASLSLTPVATTWAAAPGSAGAVELEILSLSSNDAVDEAAALTDAFKR